MGVLGACGVLPAAGDGAILDDCACCFEERAVWGVGVLDFSGEPVDLVEPDFEVAAGDGVSRCGVGGKE